MRTALKNNATITLCGEINGKLYKRDFTILSTKSMDGASVICYEAKHSESGWGVLKELWPAECETFTRNANGQITANRHTTSADIDRYIKAAAEYIAPHKSMLKLKHESDSSFLSAFIPEFTIYYGMGKFGRKNRAVYIWSPIPAVYSFDNICREIHEHPAADPERKLVTVLTSITALAEGVCEIHRAGYIHGDIKPSNFGFLKVRNEVIHEAVTLFDINTVRKVGEFCGGTKGFMAPDNPKDAKSDIYSIGATLFSSIIVTPETKAEEYRYTNSFYYRLTQLVDDSLLISSSESNSWPKLRNILVTILSKTLSISPGGRYQNCEELICDLKTAMQYAISSDIVSRAGIGNNIMVHDAQRYLDAKKKRSELAIFHHLFKYPLYNYIPVKADKINILLLGFGTYGQMFLDICLQAAQLLDKKLLLTIISNNRNEWSSYLDARPAMGKFFSLGGEYQGDSYGLLNFEEADVTSPEFSLKEKAENCSYIFIALGNDELNFRIANSCDGFADKNAGISYISRNGSESGRPIALNTASSPMELEYFEEMERMAFNNHLVWKKDLTTDFAKARSEFENPYNYKSCIGYALSVKYKLWYLGIHSKGAQAAADFEKAISKESKFNRLVWLEHRRWVTEKICDGWTSKSCSSCADGTTRDSVLKQHICLVKSSPKNTLKNRSQKYWDGGTADKNTDELDAVSLNLHRLYLAQAEEIRQTNLLDSSVLSEIRAYSQRDSSTSYLFREWFSVIKDIYNRDIGKVKLYDIRTNALLSAFEKLVSARVISDGELKKVNKYIQLFDSVFLPLKKAVEYRDWKSIDEDMIRNIPFVITHTCDSCLVVPYLTDSKNEIFNNTAAAFMANPAEIIWIYLAENDPDLVKLKNSLKYTISFMNKKRLRAKVSLMVLCDRNPPDKHDRILTELQSAGFGRIFNIELMKLGANDSLPKSLISFLEESKRGHEFFAAENRGDRLSEILRNCAPLNDEGCIFSFNSRASSFTVQGKSVNMLSFITKSPYLTVSDIAAFNASQADTSKQPEFCKDYMVLWKLYRDYHEEWKTMCSVLKSCGNLLLTTLSAYYPRAKSTYIYYLPAICCKNIRAMLDKLISERIIEAESKVEIYTSDSCRVKITDCYNNKKKFDYLFSHQIYFIIPDMIKVTKEYNAAHKCNGNVSIKCNDLRKTVSGSNLSTIMSLITELAKYGYIINPQLENNSLTLTFSTNEIKKLLTTEGLLLEIYTYEKARETAYFDDVKTGVQFFWEEENSNELDCIITKGMRMLIVECKSGNPNNLDFSNIYKRLNTLSEKHGINARAVLICDSMTEADSAVCEVGNKLGVVTIWKREEIQDIGNTLKNIMDMQ